MRAFVIFIAILAASPVVHAGLQIKSGRMAAQCYGVFDVLVVIGEIDKISKDESQKLQFKRDNAEAIALMRLDGEGVNENDAREIIYDASHAEMDALGDTPGEIGAKTRVKLAARASKCDEQLLD